MPEAKDRPEAVFCTNVQLPPGVHDFETEDDEPGTEATPVLQIAQQCLIGSISTDPEVEHLELRVGYM